MTVRNLEYVHQGKFTRILMCHLASRHMRSVPCALCVLCTIQRGLYPTRPMRLERTSCILRTRPHPETLCVSGRQSQRRRVIRTPRALRRHWLYILYIATFPITLYLIQILYFGVSLFTWQLHQTVQINYRRWDDFNMRQSKQSVSNAGALAGT